MKKTDTETEGRKESGPFDPGHMLLVIYMTLLFAIVVLGGFVDG